MDNFLDYLWTFLNFFLVGGGVGVGFGLGFYLVDLATGATKRHKAAVHRELERQELLKRYLKVQETMAATQARNSVSRIP